MNNNEYYKFKKNLIFITNEFYFFLNSPYESCIYNYTYTYHICKVTISVSK